MRDWSEEYGILTPDEIATRRKSAIAGRRGRSTVSTEEARIARPADPPADPEFRERFFRDIITKLQSCPTTKEKP